MSTTDGARTGVRHATGIKRLGLLLFSVALALVLAAPAMALKPTGEYANFGDCPLSNPAVGVCLFAQSTSGEFKIGSTAVPLAKAITLQGGVYENGAGEDKVANAADGNTLSKTPQTVPGGLLKIMAPKGWPEILQLIFNEFINKGITGVTATTELVAEPTINLTNDISASGTALDLPVRVHLENGFLGNTCYIGSKSHPVNVELTTGTTSPPLPNTPITGKVGEFEARNGGQLIIVKNNSLVNNSFAAPEAEGCGSQILFGLFTGLVDSAVDSQLGLPSAAGHNTAVLNGSQELANVEAVKASEK